MFTNREDLQGSRATSGIADLWKRGMPRLMGLLAAFALAGCEPVQSVYPFFDGGDETFEPQIAGQWRQVTKAEKGELWVLSIPPATEEPPQHVVRYGLYQDSPATGDPPTAEITFEGHFFEVGGVSYLDLVPKTFWAKPTGDVVDWQVDSGLFTAPTHTVYRVWIDGDQLRLNYLDDERVQRFVKENNLNVGADTPPRFLLTAPTREIQSEILAFAEQGALLDSDGIEFERQK